jgi:uncharacterized protein (TIGR03435 family)
LITVLVAVRFARRARASVRHLIVAASFVMLLLLPAGAVVLPPAAIEVASVAPVAPAPMEPARVVGTVSVGGAAPTYLARANDTAGSTENSAGAPLSLVWLLRGTWALGVLLFLVPMAGALWRVRRVCRNAVRWPEGEALARELSEDAGLSRVVVVLRHEDVEAPMTCGVVRPAIVLPWDVEAWSASNVRHALIHELEHVRRGDWLVHLMARLVCAAYWFHPLVWKAWQRLHLEAERACDDAVVRQSEGRAYAVQLVQLAEQLSESHLRPLLPMAGRGHLSTRVKAVLDGRVPRGRAGTVWAVGALSMAIVSAVVMAPLRAVAARPEATALRQTTTPATGNQSASEKPVIAVAGPQGIDTDASTDPSVGEKPVIPAAGPQDTAPRTEPTPAAELTFEAASIRLNTNPNVNVRTSQVRAMGQRVVAPSTTVRELVRYAYDYQFRPVSHVVGGPEWLDTERYEVIAQAAKAFSPAPGRGMLPREASAMLRAMLAERMQLKVHVETRVRLIHALVLDRADGQLGPNLTPAKGECQPSMATPDPDIPLPPCPFLLIPMGTGSLYQMKGITMPELASTFGNYPEIDELVIDRTGLTGRYDMSVRTGGGMILSPFGRPVPRSVDDTADNEFPPIRQAIREQLGVRLERTREPVEVIVIEQVERPSEN